jgi:hypothetical protein
MSGYIYKNGKVVVQLKYYSIGEFCNGFASIKISQKQNDTLPAFILSSNGPNSWRVEIID